MGKNKTNNGGGKTTVGVLKGVITALVVTVIAILLYAVVLKAFNMSDKSIPFFNQAVKILGIIIASFYTVKSTDKIIAGLISGVAFICVTFGIFSLVNGSLGSVAIFLSDVIMGGVIGTVFGIITAKLFVGDGGTVKKAK